MVQVRLQQGASGMGAFALKTKPASQVGNKDTQDGKAPKYIHENFSVFCLNRG